MKPTALLPSGLVFTNFFGFENLKEVSSCDDGVVRIRIFAAHKDTGIPVNYLVKIIGNELIDPSFMSRLKEEIKKYFIGVVDGEPK